MLSCNIGNYLIKCQSGWYNNNSTYFTYSISFTLVYTFLGFFFQKKNFFLTKNTNEITERISTACCCKSHLCFSVANLHF